VLFECAGKLFELFEHFTDFLADPVTLEFDEVQFPIDVAVEVLEITVSCSCLVNGEIDLAFLKRVQMLKGADRLNFTVGLLSNVCSQAFGDTVRLLVQSGL